MTRHRRPLAAPLVLALAALALPGCGGSPAAVPALAPTPTASLVASRALDDAAAAQAFFDAVVAGDRIAGAAVATEQALAFFDPWTRHPSYSFTAAVDGRFSINPGAGPFQCTVVEGRVTGCLDEPTGEQAATDVLRDPTSYTTYRELTVQPGGAAFAVEGSVVSGTPHDGYVVPAPGGAGEKLDVTVSALEDNASFSVYGPDDTELVTDETEVHLTLPVAGDYLVVVGPTRGNATYELSVGVSVDAS